MTPFLKQVVNHYMTAGGISGRCFIFPNRRSQVFFKKHLNEAVRASGAPVIAPKMLTINDFFYELAGTKPTDKVSLLLELYDCYKSLYRNYEPLDEFIFWGDVLLGDFDDVDKYLVNPGQLFTNVREFKEIQDSYSYLTENQRTAIESFVRHFRDTGNSGVKERFLQVWNILLPLYIRFRETLGKKGMSYEGMTYRYLAEKVGTEPVADVLKAVFGDVDEYVFVGLNALNECEKTVMRKMRDAGLASFCWDFSSGMIRDRRNNASLFMYKNLKEFGQAFQADEEGLGIPKIEVISVPSSTGQAKLIPDVVKDEEYAIVLPDESLLMPVLNSIHPTIKDINVTMGYPMRGSAFFDFITLVSALQMHIRYKDGKCLFYHSQVWSIFSSGMFRKVTANDGAAREKVNSIKTAAKYYIPLEDLSGHPVFDLIFRPVIKDPKVVSKEQIREFEEYLKSLILGLASSTGSGTGLDGEPAEPSLDLEFARKAYSAINLLQAKELDVLPLTFTRMLDQILGPMSVPFNGEPLKGLQIMGPLETRALDFKNLLILSCNEGMFPRRTVSSSFIPPELRKGFGLPTHEFQDAIWAYYFYRMIQRAETVTLVYDSRTEGLKNGEESRFIKQLEYHYNLPVRRSFVKAEARIHEQALTIPKTEEDIKKLDSVTLSASSLYDYLNCPARFYFSKVAGLKEESEVAEDLDSRTLGEVYHLTMQALYMGEGAMDPSYDMSDRKRNASFPGALKEITKEYIESWLKRKGDIKRRVRSLIMAQLHTLEVSGRNLVLEDVIVQYVLKTLQRDKELIGKVGVPSFRIIGLENMLVSEIDGFRFIGFIDRMDSFLPGEVRIIDYKTGTFENKDVNINDSNAVSVVEALFDENNKKRSKVPFQLFIYDFLASRDPKYCGNVFINSIYHPAKLFAEEVKNFPVSKTYSEEMEKKLHGLLAEIKDIGTGWRRTLDAENCSMCDFKMICGR